MSGRGRPLHLVEVGLVWPPETFLAWKLERLAEEGLRVTVATIDKPPPGTHIPGVDVRRYPHWEEPLRRVALGLVRDLAILAATRPGRLWPVLRAVGAALDAPADRPSWWRMRRLRWYLPLARLRPDVVHFEWNTAAVAFLPLTRVWRCPAVVSCHGTDVNVRPHRSDAAGWRASLRRSFAVADAVHCVSAALVEEAASLGMDRSRAWLIRTAVDPDVFAPGERAKRDPSAPLRVVSVGQLRWLKGHVYAVQAIDHLRVRGIAARLEILGGEPVDAVGENGDRARIVQTVEDLELGDRVRLLGDVSSEQVRRALADADVLLHASLTEGIPTAVLEAMACALPVVVTDVGGVSEAVTDGVEGLVVAARDAEGAADALARIHGDPELAGAMGRAGRRRVVRDFALDDQIARFLELYAHVGGTAQRATAAPAPDPSNAPATAQPGRSPDLRVLSVGSLTWRQGYEYALHAIAIAIENGLECEYRVLGDGPYRDALTFARHQLGLEDHVTFIAEDDGQAERQLRWADVLLDASVTAEPSPATARAAALGLPIVSTGSLPRRDPRSLAEGLSRVYAAAAHGTAVRTTAPPP